MIRKEQAKLSPSTLTGSAELLRRGLVRAPTTTIDPKSWDEQVISQPMPLTSAELLDLDRGAAGPRPQRLTFIETSALLARCFTASWSGQHDDDQRRDRAAPGALAGLERRAGARGREAAGASLGSTMSTPGTRDAAVVELAKLGWSPEQIVFLLGPPEPKANVLQQLQEDLFEDQECPSLVAIEELVCREGTDPDLQKLWDHLQFLYESLHIVLGQMGVCQVVERLPAVRKKLEQGKEYLELERQRAAEK